MSVSNILDDGGAPQLWSNLNVNSIKAREVEADVITVLGDVNATQLRGRNISNSAPADTNVLTWNAGSNQWEPAAGGSGDATSIQGRDVSAAAPADTNVLTWNAGSNQWEPAAGGGGGSAKTSGKVNIYWDNVSGDDGNDGLSLLTPVLNLSRAITIAKPLYFDETVINLIYTGDDYIPDAACYTDQTFIPGAESLTQKILDFKGMTKSLKLTFNGIFDTELGTDSGTINYITNYFSYQSNCSSSSYIAVQISGISNLSGLAGGIPNFVLVENTAGVQALLPVDENMTYKAGNRLFLLIDRANDDNTVDRLFTSGEAVTIKYYNTNQMPYFQIDDAFTPIFRTTDSEGTVDLWMKNLYTAFKMVMYSNFEQINYYGCYDEGYLDINTNHYNSVIDANGGNILTKFSINNNMNGCNIRFLTTNNNSNIVINGSRLVNGSISNANISIVYSIVNLNDIRNSIINFQNISLITRIESTSEGNIINAKACNLYHAYRVEGDNTAYLHTLNFVGCQLNTFGLYIGNKVPTTNTLGFTFNYENTTTELLKLTNSKADITTLYLYGRDDQKGVPNMTSLIKLVNSSLTNLTNTTNTDAFTQSINIYDVSAASKLYQTGSFSAAVSSPSAVFWIKSGSEFHTPTGATYTNSGTDNFILREGSYVAADSKTSIVQTYSAPLWYQDNLYEMIKVVKY